MGTDNRDGNLDDAGEKRRREGVDPASTVFFENITGLEPDEKQKLADLVHKLEEKDKQRLRLKVTEIMAKTELERREVLREQAKLISNACKESLSEFRKDAKDMGVKLNEHVNVTIEGLEEAIQAESKFMESADTMTDAQVLASLLRQTVEHAYYGGTTDLMKIKGTEEVQHPAAMIAAYRRGIAAIMWRIQTGTPGLATDRESVRKQGIGKKVIGFPKEIFQLDSFINQYLRQNENALALLQAQEEKRQAESKKAIAEREKKDAQAKEAEAKLNSDILKRTSRVLKRTSRELAKKAQQSKRKVEQSKRLLEKTLKRQNPLAIRAEEAEKKAKKLAEDYAKLENDKNILEDNEAALVRQRNQITKDKQAALVAKENAEKNLMEEVQAHLDAMAAKNQELAEVQGKANEQVEAAKQETEKEKQSKSNWQGAAIVGGMLSVVLGGVALYNGTHKKVIEKPGEEKTVYVNKEVLVPGERIILAQDGTQYTIAKDAEEPLKELLSIMNEDGADLGALLALAEEKKITVDAVNKAKEAYAKVFAGQTFYFSGAALEKAGENASRIEKITRRKRSAGELAAMLEDMDTDSNKIISVKEAEGYKPVVKADQLTVDDDARELYIGTLSRLAEDGAVVPEFSMKDLNGDNHISLDEVRQINDAHQYTLKLDGKTFYISKKAMRTAGGILAELEKKQKQPYTAGQLARMLGEVSKDNNINLDEVRSLRNYEK